MRERKWVDCPSCGAKGDMRACSELSERLQPKGYPSLEVQGLSGQFCEVCGEGFWSLKSERKIAQEVAEHMARHDAKRVVAAEMASVQEAAEALSITVQGVHKMMQEGRLRFVYAAGRRFPLREDLVKKAAS